MRYTYNSIRFIFIYLHLHTYTHIIRVSHEYIFADLHTFFCFHRQVFWIRRICWKRSPICRWVNSKCPRFCMEFPWIFFTTKGRNPAFFEKGSRKKLSRFKPGCRVLPEFMKLWIFPLEKSVMSTVHIGTYLNQGPDPLPKTIFVHWGTRCFSKTWWAHLCLDNDILCCRLQAQTRHPPGLSLQAVILMDEKTLPFKELLWKTKTVKFFNWWAFESQDMEKKSHARYWIFIFYRLFMIVLIPEQAEIVEHCSTYSPD